MSPVHDQSIDCGFSIFIWTSTRPNCTITPQFLTSRTTLDDSIDCRTPRINNLPGSSNSLQEGPCAHHQRVLPRILNFLSQRHEAKYEEDESGDDVSGSHGEDGRGLLRLWPTVLPHRLASKLHGRSIHSVVATGLLVLVWFSSFVLRHKLIRFIPS